MTTKQPTAFTARESEILTVAFQCIKERPNVRCMLATCLASLITDHNVQINFELMATQANFQSAKSARDTFNKLYNKILSGQNGEGSEQGDEPSPKKKATPSKRKADDEEASPTKKKKATPGKSKGKKKPVAADEDDDDTIAVKSELVEQDGVDE
jgi:DNA invertase Pin-like site-specific DNA recombinase